MKDRFNLKIDAVAFGGAGVGRKDGLVIFVPFTAPGDVAQIEVIQCKKKFARGRLLKIVAPSPWRTDPLCKYYGACGGCAYQHIRYERQLDIKRKQVEDAFTKIGGLAAPAVAPVIASPQMYAYRGKATLHAARTGKSLQLGFMDISGGALADIDRCEIMHETINDQIRQIRSAQALSSREEDITLWSEPCKASEDAVIRNVEGREFLVPRNGFFQANIYLTGRMVAEVCRLLDRREIRTVVDACCGCGLFSLFTASHASRVLGVEVHEKSVEFARLNAKRQGITNTEFIRGDIADVLGGMARKKESVDVVVLDPPRTGLDPQAIAAISSIKPMDIIYISCNPATQARDVRAFMEAGFELKNLQPLDMFPQTDHIETIGLLRRQ